MGLTPQTRPSQAMKRSSLPVILSACANAPPATIGCSLRSQGSFKMLQQELLLTLAEISVETIRV